MDAEKGTWNGYCCLCGGFGHRADSCRWNRKRIAAEGLEAVRGVFKRGNAAGKWGCSGDEYRAIGAALALGAELADSTNRRTVANAIKTVFQEAGR
jgi:hypothetical protein